MDSNIIQQLEQRVQILQQAPAPSTQLVDALNELAHAYDAVHLQKGIATAQSACILARSLVYPQGEADSLIVLSWLLVHDNRLDAACLQAQHAQFIANHLQDAQRLARCTHVMAVVHHAAGNLARAEALWQELLAMARREANRAREADYLTALGILRQEQSDLALAYDYKQHAHEIYVELDDPQRVISLNNLAFLLTKMGQHERALACATDALQRCPPEHKAWRSTILDTLGLIHLHQRNYHEARRLLSESIHIAQGAGINKQQAIRSLMDLSRLEWECNNRPAACEHLLNALTLAEAIQSTKLQLQAHQSLYRYYLQMKAYEAASQHHEQYLACDHEMGCRKMEKQVQIMRANAVATTRRQEWIRDSQVWLQVA